MWCCLAPAQRPPPAVATLDSCSASKAPHGVACCHEAPLEGNSDVPVALPLRAAAENRQRAAVLTCLAQEDITRACKSTCEPDDTGGARKAEEVLPVDSGLLELDGEDIPHASLQGSSCVLPLRHAQQDEQAGEQANLRMHSHFPAPCCMQGTNSRHAHAWLCRCLDVGLQ